MFRIISGKFRNRKLELPSDENTRPTMERIRESIFNSLQDKIEHSIILDGFAGSGAMGFEAISRGATKVIGVEINKKIISIIQKNKELLNINNYELIHDDFISFLKNKANIKFDIIFLDPPYKSTPSLQESLDIICNKSFLQKYGTIVIETSLQADLLLPDKMMIDKERKYKNKKVLFIKNII